MELPRWDACTMEPRALLRWIECHPGLAGYIQAVGVVATVALALLGPPAARLWAAWKHRRARRRQTRAIALALIPFVNQISETIGDHIHQILETKAVSDFQAF